MGCRRRRRRPRAREVEIHLVAVKVGTEGDGHRASLRHRRRRRQPAENIHVIKVDDDGHHVSSRRAGTTTLTSEHHAAPAAITVAPTTARHTCHAAIVRAGPAEIGDALIRRQADPTTLAGASERHDGSATNTAVGSFRGGRGAIGWPNTDRRRSITTQATRRRIRRRVMTLLNRGSRLDAS